jgi:hypothetical protein
MNKELSGAQKAAILLRAIGEEAAAAVMKTLDPKDIRKLGILHERDGEYYETGRGQRDRRIRAGELHPARCSLRDANSWKPF